MYSFSCVTNSFQNFPIILRKRNFLAVIQFFCSLIVSEDPPRPQEGSPLFLEMGGYMAARGDFNVEHNNFVELELKDMVFDEEKEDSEDEDDEHFMRGTVFLQLRPQPHLLHIF